MQRWQTKPPWRTHQRVTVGPAGTDENHSVTVLWEFADLEDTQAHVTWEDGAHRVSAKYSLSGRAYKRARTYKGETAWMHAQRDFDDITTEIRLSGKGW